MDANINMEGGCTTFQVPGGRIRQFDGHLLLEDQKLTDILESTETTFSSFTVLLTANISYDYTQSVSFKDKSTMFLSYLVLRVGDDFLRNETA